MAFHLDNVVPWGRSFDEYVAMFSLSSEDLHKRILGCADGPASFNAEMNQRGLEATSIDPLYSFPAREIRRRIDETFEEVVAQTRANRREFVWHSFKTVEELAATRMRAMDAFLADYESGKVEGRYLPGELPRLPVESATFDLALSSHLLFLYSARFGEEFHVASIHELHRVAAEVRIFPLLELGSVASRHLDGVLSMLSAAGIRYEIRPVDYEFQRGGNRMLRIFAS